MAVQVSIIIIMNTWAIYAILAGAAYGLSAVPMRYVSSRSHLSAPSEHIFMFSSIGALIGAMVYLLSSENISQSLILKGNVKVAIIAMGAGLVGSIGSLFVIKALSFAESSTSNVMAAVNTNALFALGFGMLFLQEIPAGVELYRLLFGSVLIMIGAGLICR